MLQRLKLEIWKSIHSLPLGLIHIWQLLALRRLVRHAYANTALYRDLWDKRGVKPSHLKQLSDLERFPIINKQTFSQFPLEAYLGFTEAKFHTWRHTSGTTGKPFSFISVNNWYSSYTDFLNYRFLYWEGFSHETILKKMKKVVIISVGKKIAVNSQFGIPYHHFLTNTKDTMEEIQQILPDVLSAFPSVLVEIAQTIIQSSQLNKFKVKYVIVFGENLKVDQRKFIEKSLGCEVIDRYGLEEFGAVATECKYHNGFHLSAESFYLEIVNDDGLPVPFGKKGRIILTDLRNYAMPFIRYDTGDQGYFLSTSCPCGLEGELFIVEGRVGESLLFGEKKIHYVEFERVFESLSGAIIQYQVAKIDENTVTLSIIRGPAMTEFILERIREHMQSLIGLSCHLNIEFVTEIKRTPRGKCQTLINA